MTTHELRERLEGLAKEWQAEVTGEYGYGFQEGLERAYSNCADRLASLLSEMGNGWIPVSERLPKIGIDLLVTGHEGEGYMETAIYVGREDDGCFQWDRGNEDLFYGVTHWQPLPEGPKR